MRKLHLIIAFLFVPFLCFAGNIQKMQQQTIQQYNAAAAAGAAFCAGGELFCDDFEGTDTSWLIARMMDADCVGLDDPEECCTGSGTGTCQSCNLTDDGEMCDDSPNYAANATGSSEGISFVGNYNESYVIETLSSADQTEFYIEAWVRYEDNTGSASVVLESDASYDVVRFGSSTTLLVEVKSGNVDLDTGDSVTADTWYHVGVYYKQETASGADDGTVRVWRNEDGTEFDAGDLISDDWEGNVDTGTTGADQIQIRGNSTSGSIVTDKDDTKVITGAPSWPIS